MITIYTFSEKNPTMLKAGKYLIVLMEKFSTQKLMTSSFFRDNGGTLNMQETTLPTFVSKWGVMEVLISSYRNFKTSSTGSCNM